MSVSRLRQRLRTYPINRAHTRRQTQAQFPDEQAGIVVRPHPRNPVLLGKPVLVCASVLRLKCLNIFMLCRDREATGMMYYPISLGLTSCHIDVHQCGDALLTWTQTHLKLVPKATSCQLPLPQPRGAHVPAEAAASCRIAHTETAFVAPRETLSCSTPGSQGSVLMIGV